MKKCPQCAEKVQSKAVVCRYCGHRFEEDGSPAQRSPSRRRWLIAGVVVLVLAAAGGAGAWWLLADGGDDESAPESSADEQASAEAEAAAQECEEELDPLLSELEELDSRLNVGVSYDEYGDYVGDARVEYDRLSTDELEPDCLADVAVPAESALNSYGQAGNVWNRCFDDLGCDNDDIQPELREHWSDATASIETARSGVEDLREGAGPEP